MLIVSISDSRIKWQPTVLSFSFSSKELKANDPLSRIRLRLEDLDIKAIIPYVVDHTTHVVQNKRNTAKGLQALVNGKWIVDESYVDALVYAATPSDLENLESLSPLEADFDTAWPDAGLHLPPPGNEPVQRPPEAFAPNPNRTNIFDGYTFVFGDPSQYENLADPINNGHGKALLYQVEQGVTTAEEIAQYMRNAAGNKGLGDERSGPGGVVLVRFRSKGRYEEWSIDVGTQVAVLTDQRVIEQREFLDAILANDASSLCRSLPPGPESSQAAPAESASQPVASQQAVQPALTPSGDFEPPPSSQNPAEPSQSSSFRPRPPRVRSFASKMKTFDDGFDISSVPAYTPEDEGPSDSPAAMDLDPISEPPSGQPSQRASHRRPQSSRIQERHDEVDDEEQQEQEEEDVMAGLLPGANAMKRRRAKSGPRRDSPSSQPQEAAERKPKRAKLDVLEAARQHREAEEDAQRRQQEEDKSLRQSSLKDTDIEKLKGLAIVEEMNIPLRKPPQLQTVPQDDRWDERWNGRKNFKKFQRKGEPRRSRHRVQAVIVPLEEVSRKDYGIGDQYWVSSRTSREDGHRGSLSLQSEEGTNRPEEENGGRMDEDDGPIPLTTRPQSIARAESQSTSLPRSQSRSQKRTREVRDSDSDDELRFRFRRRR